MKMYQVDAFTTQLFKGNPAAVIVLDEWLDDALMQNIALENNLSEEEFALISDKSSDEIQFKFKLLEFFNYSGLITAKK